MAFQYTENTRIGFVGLGVMGGAMAGHILRQHGSVAVFNRTPAKAQAWQTAHPTAVVCQNLTELAQQVDAVVLCIGNDDDVRSTVHTVLPHLKSGALIIDHTTTSVTLAQEMAALCALSNVIFLDCPVSGGQAGAVNGALTVMAGGDEQAFEAALPVLKMYSRSQTRFGESGAGQGCKMVNQVLITGVLQGLSEGIHLAAHLGLDAGALVNTLKHGAANSWQLEHRGETMGQRQFDFGFAIDWMRKDLGIVADYIEKAQLHLPLMSQVRATYEQLSAQGFGRDDTSALIRQFDKLA